MSNEHLTDYQPGDEPVAPGTVVVYRDRDYEVVDHGDVKPDVPESEYPDGVSYLLFPAGQPKKFGSSEWVSGVRRRSFYVKTQLLDAP
ncbi:hypothetical protein AB0E08_07555 [Streptomyces sp. NPDC048281]|uniref:hypothetical protein n=1 Tax=Streptomyces sp. NPDC048281 TaxID=3154715 RepID=UPI003438AC0F